MRLFLALALVYSFSSMAAARAQEPSATPPTPAETATAPLPDVRELMLEVERNQRRFDAARQNYTYHVRTVEEDFDSHSNVKKTTVTEAESLSIGGVRVDKVVAKNGRPLTADEQQKESERIDKEVARAKAKRAKNEDKGRDSDAEGHPVLSAARILELGTFSNPRRVALDGRSAVLLDYAGDPHAHTHNNFEAVFKDLTGQVWIDEQDRVRVRGEGHFPSDFKIGGGLLADVHSGFHFDFRSAKVNGEVWLPARIEAEGSARFLLFVQVRGRLTVTVSDYRKFRTSSTILPTSRVIGQDGLPVPDAPEPPQPPAAMPPH